jgi:hypothetical protein
MPLHIFLGDEVLLYCIVQVEVIEIQVWFEFNVVCNLQKGLKIYRGFSNFLSQIGPNPGPGPVGLLPRMDRSAQRPASVAQPATGRAPPLLRNPTRLAQSNLIAR